MSRTSAVRCWQRRFSILMLFVLVGAFAAVPMRPIAAASSSTPVRATTSSTPAEVCPDIVGMQHWEADVSFTYSLARSWILFAGTTYQTNYSAHSQRSVKMHLVFARTQNPFAWRLTEMTGTSSIDERVDARSDGYYSVSVERGGGPVSAPPSKPIHLDLFPERCEFTLDIDAIAESTSFSYDKFKSPRPSTGPDIAGGVWLFHQPFGPQPDAREFVVHESVDLPVRTEEESNRKVYLNGIGIRAMHEQFGHEGIGNARVNWTVRGTNGSKPALSLDEEMLKRNVYLNDVHVTDRFDANVDWGVVDDGEVTWKIADRPQEKVPTTSRKVPKEVDVGAQGVGEKLLIAQAKNSAGQTTPPANATLSIAPLMDWCSLYGAVTGAKVGPAVSYRCGFKWPEPSFAAQVTAPGWLPFFKGKPMGIKETQAAVDLEVKSSSEGSIKGGAQSGFEAMGGSIIGAFAVKGDVLLDKAGVKIPSGSAEFSIGGKLEKEEPLISAVPAFLSALAWLEGFSPATAQWIARRAMAKLELEPKINFAALFEAGANGINWKAGETTPAMGFKVTTALKLFDSDDDDDIEARVGVGGESAITYKVPKPYFKQIDLKFIAFGAIKFRTWLLEREKAWTWSSAGGLMQPATQSTQSEDPGPGWQPMDRGYLAAPDYAKWTGTTTTTRGLVDQPLVQNIYPMAKPAITENTNGEQYLVWAHDEPGSSAIGGQELAFARGGSSGWPNTYKLLTDDNQSDLNPSVVRLPNNKLLVVWERMDTATPPAFETDPKGYLSHSQIAAGAFWPTTSTPTVTPLMLSAGSFNHKPRIGALDSAVGSDDGALAIWISNSGNQLIGDSANPDTLMFSRYRQNAETWSPAATVVGDLRGVLNLEFATAGDKAAVVYSRDMDADLATEGDRELFYVLFENGAWGAPVQLTANGVDDMAPELVLTAAGAPQLMWKQGRDLRFMSGGWNTATSTVLPLAAAVSGDNRSMVVGKDGSLVLTWQEAGEGDTRIGYAFRDGTSGIWSDARYLQPPVGTHSVEGQSALVVDMAALVSDQAISSFPICLLT